MPYVEHIDYAPDPVVFLSTQPVILSEAKDLSAAKARSPERLGALMRGPLVMAALGIKTWDEAVLHLGPDGRPAALQPVPTAADGPELFTLNGLTFIPDYQADTSITHYLRIR